MRVLSILLLVVFCAAPSIACEQPALETITAAEIQAHVDVLAGPAMEGRGAGSEGGRLAGDYIAAELAALGLTPAADGWFQEFRAMRNVVAILPGSDPALADEFVVIGGHYDHLGHGDHGGSLAPFSRGNIHWGADDNASGTAGVIEIAEALVAARPRRSVMFLLFDGEERGLLGAEHFIAQPLVPLDKIVAMCNLDMIGRLEGRPITVYGANSGSSFDAAVRNGAAALSVELELVSEMTPNSDHYPFYRAGIPALHLFSGLHEDYHRPGDTADKLDAEGAEQIARLACAVVTSVANADQRPTWAEVPMGGMDWKDMLEALGLDLDRLDELFPGRGGRDKPKLGVTLEDGLVIGSIIDDTPAARSGLRVGDTLLALDAEPVRDLGQLREALRGLQGRHTFVILRGSEELEVVVDFGGVPEQTRERWF